MKKMYLGAITGMCGLLLLTGCGSGNKVTCSSEFEESGHKFSSEIVASLDGDNKVKDVSASMTFENADDAEQFYSMYQGILDMAKSYGGEEEVPKIDIKKEGNKIIIDNFAEFEKMSSDDDSANIIGMTKEDFIKQIESDEEEKWSCK